MPGGQLESYNIKFCEKEEVPSNISWGDALESPDEPLSGKCTLQPAFNEARGTYEDEIWPFTSSGQV